MQPLGAFRIAADHPALPGHFPGRPVVPGVVLLDEVEKAHPDVHEMFFQVFDKGYMDDSEGRHIDFKNTLILLTSNVGTELITLPMVSEKAREAPRQNMLKLVRSPEREEQNRRAAIRIGCCRRSRAARSGSSATTWCAGQSRRLAAARTSSACPTWR